MRLQDISETETHQLNSLMGLLTDQTRTIFNGNNTLADEVILLLSSLPLPPLLVIVFSGFSIKSLWAIETVGIHSLLEEISTAQFYPIVIAGRNSF